MSMQNEYEKFCEEKIDELVLLLETNDIIKKKGFEWEHPKVLKKIRKTIKKINNINHARDIIDKNKASVKWASEISDMLENYQAKKEIDDAIRLLWPNRIENICGDFNCKSRNNLRSSYKYHIEREAWRKENPNASCANCGYLNIHPTDKSKYICDFGHSYTLTTKPEDNDCMKWIKK